MLSPDQKLATRRYRDETPEEARARYRAYYAANAEHRRAIIAKSRAKVRDRLRVSEKAWRERNAEKIRENRRAHAQTPKAKATHCAKMARRNAQKRNALPGWANLDAIKAIYAKAALLTFETGISHQVDHVVPLVHELVCGLHVERNLQILTEEANRLKSNRWPA